MTVLLGIAALLLAIAVGMLATLVIRRLVLARSDRRFAAAERRVRPIAIELIEGVAEPPELPPGEQAALTKLIGRYSRKVGGETTERIAAYFREGGRLEAGLAALRSGREWRRATAAYGLGDMACAEAVPALLEALNDRSAVVRTAAVRSLGRLRRPEAALPLVESLVAHRVPRGLAGSALLELGVAAIPELHRIVGHEDPPVRSIAITVLGLVGDSGDAGLAIDALRDPAAEVRAAAARALGRIGTPAAEPALRAALDDRVHFVRAEAAASLGAVNARPALPQLLTIARTDRFRPARAAAQAVAAIDPGTLRAAAAEPGAGAHLHEAADLAAL
jgi:HEAT repeat protein